MVGFKHACLPTRRRARTIEQRAQHADGGNREGELPHAAEREGFGKQAYDLGICLRARFANALNAHLGDLASLGLALALSLAEHALRVTETQRTGFARQTRGAHTGNLQRDVRTHGKQIAARVEEFKRRAGQTTSGLHDVHNLEGGRLNGKVSAIGEELLHASRNALAHDGFFSEHIAETRWSH